MRIFSASNWPLFPTWESSFLLSLQHSHVLIIRGGIMMIMMMVMILTIMVMMVVVRMITITLMLILMKMIVTIKIVIMIKRKKVQLQEIKIFCISWSHGGGTENCSQVVLGSCKNMTFSKVDFFQLIASGNYFCIIAGHLYKHCCLRGDPSTLSLCALYLLAYIEQFVL